jgi:AcrR family transcriptional regulator
VLQNALTKLHCAADKMPPRLERKVLPRASRHKGEAKRRQILETAKGLLLAGGPGAVVLREVAAKLGMTHSNVQYYYPTRDELLVAIYDEELAKFTGSVERVAAIALTRPARLAAVIDLGLALIRAPDTALWRLMVGMLDHSPEMAALHRKECRLYEDRLVAELKVIAPHLSAARRRSVAKIIQAIIDGMSIQAVHESKGDPVMRIVDNDIKRAIASLIEAD